MAHADDPADRIEISVSYLQRLKREKKVIAARNGAFVLIEQNAPMRQGELPVLYWIAGVNVDHCGDLDIVLEAPGLEPDGWSW